MASSLRYSRLHNCPIRMKWTRSDSSLSGFCSRETVASPHQTHEVKHLIRKGCQKLEVEGLVELVWSQRINGEKTKVIKRRPPREVFIGNASNRNNKCAPVEMSPVSALV